MQPIPGQVIRYSYLWTDEHERGREEGSKDRPCVIVIAVEGLRDGNEIVMVLPVTHSPPVDRRLAIEIPHATKRRLGLDDAQSWIILNQVNRFTWPGQDIRPLPGKHSFLYGELPGTFFDRTKAQFLAALYAKHVSIIPRTE